MMHDSQTPAESRNQGLLDDYKANPSHPIETIANRHGVRLQTALRLLDTAGMFGKNRCRRENTDNGSVSWNVR